MAIAEFFRKLFPNPSEKQSPGEPGVWVTIQNLAVSDGSIWAGDPFVAAREEGYMVEVANGDYTVEVKWSDSPLGRKIGRVRVKPASLQDVELGSQVGEVSVDQAVVGICDMNALDKAVAGQDDEFQEHIEKFRLRSFGQINFPMAGDIQIVYVESGIGDGAYPAFNVLSDDQIVGLEVEFLP